RRWAALALRDRFGRAGLAACEAHLDARRFAESPFAETGGLAERLSDALHAAWGKAAAKPFQD
ncbi:MAG: hypothetical protein AAF192_18260, partial [Pseudomonadota bacterium]